MEDDTNDLLEQLRTRHIKLGYELPTESLFSAAADEIDRLNAENARLREALTEIIRQHERFVPDDELCDLHYQGGLEACSGIARAALGEKEK